MIDSFFGLLRTLRTERDHMALNIYQKSSLLSLPLGSIEEQYTSFLTPYAMEKLQSQIKDINNVKLYKRDDNITVVESSEGHLNVSSISCECTFFKSMKLPCKHILFVRSHEKLDLYCEDLVNKRWTLQNYKSCQRVFQPKPLSTIAASTSTPPHLLLTPRRANMTKFEKFRKASCISQQLASLASLGKQCSCELCLIQSYIIH